MSVQTPVEKMMQREILEKMLKLSPEFKGDIYELLQYDKYWHRFDGHKSESKDLSLCGHTFDKVSDDKYMCESLADIAEKEVPICPVCLSVWKSHIDLQFDGMCGLGEFEVHIGPTATAFVEKFIRDSNYQEFNNLVDTLLVQYMVKIKEERKSKIKKAELN